jgi:hypothetical protein
MFVDRGLFLSMYFWSCGSSLIDFHNSRATPSNFIILLHFIYYILANINDHNVQLNGIPLSIDFYVACSIYINSCGPEDGRWTTETCCHIEF